MKPYDQMDTDEISNVLDDKEKELRAAIEAQSIVELEDLRLAKEVAEISLKRKNLAPGLVQAKHNIRRITSELRELKNRYWKARQ